MYHVAVSEFPVEGFTWKIVYWAQQTFRIPLQKKNLEYGVWLCIYSTICQFHVDFLYRLFLKTFLTLQFNKRNSVYFKTIAHCVCCLTDIWNVYGVVSVQQVALWCVCVCVCVCVLRMGQFGAGLGEWVCSRWLCGVCVCVCVLRVGQFRAGLQGVCVQQVALWRVCVSIVCCK